MLSFKSKLLLFPYWITLKIRHFLYDKNIKKSCNFDIPIICVGNITVGGTGKTPFTEMIVRRLNGLESERYNVMVLSRGYKRETKGFMLVNSNDNYRKVGDEPLQIKNKFPDNIVAVCENRRSGIERLVKLSSESGDKRKPLIILDDAFQHRRIIPKHSVVLMNYNNPIFNDNLLPIGRLRDLPEQIKRAQSIVVTNCPFYFSNEEYYDNEEAIKFLADETAEWERDLKLQQNQSLYFAATSYNDPLPVIHDLADNRYLYAKSAVLFSGIANDVNFKNYICENYKVLDSLIFSDHCNYGKRDAAIINNLVIKYPLSVIFTTEKDSVRLLSNKYISTEVKKRLFYIPIETRILSKEKEDEFIARILQ